MRIWLIIYIFSLSHISLAETIYRYQDENGRWHFTDKKPKNDHEQLTLSVKKHSKDLPYLQWSSGGKNARQLMAINPLYAPVEFEVWDGKQKLAAWVVEAQESSVVKINNKPLHEWPDHYTNRYRIGRPIQQSDGQPLLAPIPTQGKYRITQSFNGRFSHSQVPNKHAVDIAMNISDFIHAAREGVVIEVKDDYHMGGTDKFFLDKANYVTILHEDDTYAVYAHILLGSAVVKVGQKVKAGEVLANAGTSGYSTGPHLHFVLRANNGEKIISLPFQFRAENKPVVPKADTWLRF